MKKENILILFFKYPEKGKVKTRLAESVGEQHAFNLYENMLTDLYNTVDKVPFSKITFSTQRGRASCYTSIYDTFLQEGADLGEKMLNAFMRAFSQGYSRAVLTGSDCPEITAGLLKDAFKVLKNKDYVLGPAADGGYYLIGMKKEVCSSYIFTDIPWSTPYVLDVTTERLDSKRYTYKFLQVLNDIDTFEDAKTFFQKNRENHDSETIKYLSGMRKDKNEI